MYSASLLFKWFLFRLRAKHTSLKYFRAYFPNCRSKFEIYQSLIEAVRPGKENINFRSRMYSVSDSGTRLSAVFDYLANWRPLYVLNLWIHKRELLLSKNDMLCDKSDRSMNFKLAQGYKVNLSTINFIYGSINKQTTKCPSKPKMDRPKNSRPVGFAKTSLWTDCSFDNRMPAIELNSW